MYNISQINTENYDLVAKTDGWNYSIKSRTKNKWVNNKAFKPVEYSPSPGYVPLHLKNLRRGMKLFLEERLPGFKRKPEFFSGRQ